MRTSIELWIPVTHIEISISTQMLYNRIKINECMLCNNRVSHADKSVSVESIDSDTIKYQNAIRYNCLLFNTVICSIMFVS